MTSDNANLTKQREKKNDEFYTQLIDIENELKYYTKHFEGKTVLCNCDDPRVSNFFKYFSLNFENLKLKKLITTCYKSRNLDSFSKCDSDKAIYLEYNGDKNNNRVPDPEEIGIFNLESDGDFRSNECIEILKQADIVCTNPPFSLFREYIGQLLKHKKKFIIIGNQNAITYKEIFPKIRENKIWLGVSIHSGDREFGIPDSYVPTSPSLRIDTKGRKYVRVVGVRWFTNLDYKKRHEDLILYRKYNKIEYPKFDNYNAINVDKTKDIPSNYYGIIGVPITFMDKFNPDQFEIIDSNDIRSNSKVPFKAHGLIKDKEGTVIGSKKPKYVRIVIKQKRTLK